MPVVELKIEYGTDIWMMFLWIQTQKFYAQLSAGNTTQRKSPRNWVPPRQGLHSGTHIRWRWYASTQVQITQCVGWKNVVTITTSGVISNDRVSIMTTLSFQCIALQPFGKPPRKMSRRRLLGFFVYWWVCLLAAITFYDVNYHRSTSITNWNRNVIILT